MTNYLYNPTSTIEKIAFKKADNGSTRAYLVAGDHASEADIVKVVKAICDQGLYAIHSMCDGKPALEVRGYLFEKSVRDLMSGKNFVMGEPKIEQEKGASFTESLRGRTLQGTSGFFMAADYCYSRYGYLEGHPEGVAAGIAYGIGSATMGLVGTNAQAVDEIKRQTRKLLAYTKEHGIDTSKSFAVPIVTENNKRDVFHQIVDFLQTYPTEIGNSFTSLAGSLIAYESYKYKVAPKFPAGHSKASGYMDIGLGLSTITSGLVGAWVKEKKHDPDVPRQAGLAGMWEWIQERPLSVAAFGYMCSTACHTFSTIVDYRKAHSTGDQKTLGAVKWRAGFIGCTIIGEILMALSSKGHGEGVKSDPSTEDSVLSIAAEIIVGQKPAVQAELIDNISTFLGRADVLGGKDTDMKQRLAQKVAMMRNNPWAHALSEVNKDAVPAAIAARPAMAKELTAWQAKVAASQALTPTTSL